MEPAFRVSGHQRIRGELVAAGVDREFRAELPAVLGMGRDGVFERLPYSPIVDLLLERAGEPRGDLVDPDSALPEFGDDVPVILRRGFERQLVVLYLDLSPAVGAP